MMSSTDSSNWCNDCNGYYAKCGPVLPILEYDQIEEVIELVVRVL